MLIKLVKVRLKALFFMIFGRRLGNKPRGPAVKVLVALFAVYVIGALFFSMGSMMYAIAGPLIGAGLSWLYFAMAALLASALCIMGSIFTVQKELFDATDNELLLSMPIPVSYILASRLSVIVVLELLYTVLLMLPAGVVYAIFAHLTVQAGVTLVVASLLLTLLMLAVSTLFGWLVGLLTSHMRSKTLITTLFMLAFLGLYLWLYSNMSGYMNQLISQGSSIADAVQTALPPIYNFGMAVAAEGVEGLANLGMFALWCLIPFGIMYFILTRSFLTLATTSKSTVKIEYKKREMKVTSSFNALVTKELRRFFSLPAYLINCGLGAIFLLVLAGGVVFKRADIMAILAQIPGGETLLAPMLCAGMCFCALMTDSAAPSLSLEGKSLWVLKAHPIKPIDIFNAKIAVNLIIGLPCVIVAALTCWFTLPLGLADAALVLIVPVVFMFFTAVYGMVMNILFPRFEWVNETLVIKQSGSVMAAVLGGMAIVAVPMILFIPASGVMSPTLYLALCAVLFAAVTAAMYGWITKGGVKRFASM
jgi:ABC-2 type transporter.